MRYGNVKCTRGESLMASNDPTLRPDPAMSTRREVRRRSPQARPVGRRRRQHRMVRLLSLRHRSRAGVSDRVLLGDLTAIRRPHRLIQHLRRGLRGAAHRSGAVRSCGRQTGQEGGVSGSADHDGSRNDARRCPALVSHGRRLLAACAHPAATHTRPRGGRPVGVVRFCLQRKMHRRRGADCTAVSSKRASLLVFCWPILPSSS